MENELTMLGTSVKFIIRQRKMSKTEKKPMESETRQPILAIPFLSYYSHINSAD